MEIYFFELRRTRRSWLSVEIFQPTTDYSDGTDGASYINQHLSRSCPLSVMGISWRGMIRDDLDVHGVLEHDPQLVRRRSC